MNDHVCFTVNYSLNVTFAARNKFVCSCIPTNETSNGIKTIKTTKKNISKKNFKQIIKY